MPPGRDIALCRAWALISHVVWWGGGGVQPLRTGLDYVLAADSFVVPFLPLISKRSKITINAISVPYELKSLCTPLRGPWPPVGAQERMVHQGFYLVEEKDKRTTSRTKNAPVNIEKAFFPK